MIHLIYIYFIINAFIAGMVYKNHEGIDITLFMFVLGVPFYLTKFIVIIICAIALFIRQKTWIASFLKLWFTNHYGSKEHLRLDYAKERYKTAGYFERQFIKQLDKKYNYGILEKEVKL